MITDILQLVGTLKKLGDMKMPEKVGKGLDKAFPDSLANIAKTSLNAMVYDRESIKNKARDLVMQYPVLFSDSFSSDTVLLVSRALEHEYVNLVKLIMSNENIEELGKQNKTQDYIKKFHSNIKYKPDLDFSVESGDVIEASKEMSRSILEGINFSNLNELTIPNKVLRESKKKDENDETINVNVNDYKIKKINDLVPTLLDIDMNYINAGVVVKKKITFAVKCNAHLLSTEDIVEKIPQSITTSSPLFKFVQWRSGEITFLKDFLLNFNELKKLASSNNNRRNFWWRKLQSLSKTASYGKMITKSNDFSAIPTASMVINKLEIDAIKNNTGMDLINKPTFVGKIMKKFFLLNFIIVDEATQTMLLYNEKIRDFDYYSFDSLKQGTKETSFNIKDVYPLLK